MFVPSFSAFTCVLCTSGPTQFKAHVGSLTPCLFEARVGGGTAACRIVMEDLPRDVAGKIARAQALKEQGNQFFKEQKIKKAIGCYQQVNTLRPCLSP